MRGGGNAAAQALYWQAKKDVSFVIAFESERERNAAIMLARRFACDCNVSINKDGVRKLWFCRKRCIWKYETDVFVAGDACRARRQNRIGSKLLKNGS